MAASKARVAKEGDVLRVMTCGCDAGPVLVLVLQSMVADWVCSSCRRSAEPGGTVILGPGGSLPPPPEKQPLATGPNPS